MGILIAPDGHGIPIFPTDAGTGFTKAEIDQLIHGDAKASPLQTGELLLVDSLFCSCQPGEANDSATRLLRKAADDVGGQVCGHALLLSAEEAIWLSPSLRTSLFLDREDDPCRILLLDRNEAFRSIMAVVLEEDYFRIVQVRTAAEAIEFCQHHVIHLLVADVNSLGPPAVRHTSFNSGLAASRQDIAGFRIRRTNRRSFLSRLTGWRSILSKTVPCAPIGPDSSPHGPSTWGLATTRDHGGGS